ncbi:hypothetical protein BD410DRAFT_791188 [Rickenella mellea]|uniref:Uncharacterized protein n=1 Tax=Rickenella mellea TaxID=50990 RepID=A0A4Y7PYZ1_9AGAM|nr:hypothetical protein BD410DRAFT_791188 [Rickenella mellea]
MTRSKNGAVDAQFPTRKGTLFGFRSSPARGGWVQASGGEEWESDGEEERGLRGAGAAMPMSDRVGGAAGGQEMPAEGPYASGGHGERDGRWSTSTVRLEAPGKDTGEGEETFYDPYEDTSPTHNEHEQQQQPQHLPGQIDTAAHVAQRHQSSDSTNTISPTTFAGGTKFKEGLS